MVSRKKRMARAAAKRIPIIGTAVVVAPILTSATEAGLSLATIGNMDAWKLFFRRLGANFAGFDESGTVNSVALARTYSPIAAYLLARRFAGKHISRILRPLGVKF